MADPARHQRALGAFLGVTVGDALGAPFEFQPAGSYRSRFPEPVLGGIGEMAGGGLWEPGEFTDDTQMAVMVAESLIELGEVDQDDLERRFRAWAATDPKDIGISTRAVLSAPGSAVTAAADYFAQHPKGGAGNGSLMRTIPAAVFFAPAGRDATMDAARRISEITHGDPAAGEGCAIYHELVRVALDGGDPLLAIPSALEAVPPEQRGRYGEMLAETWTPDDTDLPNGSVWTALAQAVWAVRHADSFEDAVVSAIDLGDDADTVGAITGGLAGAIWGVGAIPSRWLTYVHGSIGATTYGLRDLQHIGGALTGKQPVPEQGDEPTIPPREVLSGLWLTNLPGVRQAPAGAATISLCRTKGYTDDRPVRREVFLIDQDGANPALDLVLDDIVRTVEAFHADDLDVVVHCHGGRSRTGLVLRAWLMHTRGLSETDATEEALRLWPHTALWSEDFTEALRRREPVVEDASMRPTAQRGGKRDVSR